MCAGRAVPGCLKAKNCFDLCSIKRGNILRFLTSPATTSKAPRVKLWPFVFAFMIASRFLLLVFLAAALPAFSQTRPKAPAKAPGGFNYSAVNLIYRSNGVRLEGTPAQPARVQSPELEVSAQVIAFDLAGNSISEVRAQNSVNLKLNFAPRAGGAGARIEARCSSAVLTPGARKLELKGNLSGFYQIAGGAKNTLSGDAATLTFANGNLVADLAGGAQGVVVSIPAETLGRPDALGALTITAQRARINQSDGSATFSGRARAVSKGGSNNFDVSATEFVLTRGSDGTISTLKTTGRTLVKLDLPPDAAPAKIDSGEKSAVGKPTRVEVASNGALIDRATSTATFDGDVKGFYTLAPAVGAPQNFDFAGNRAVVRYVAPTEKLENALAGLSVQVTGAPVSLEGPSFDFGF